MMTATVESDVDPKLCELLEEFMSMLRKGQGIPVREFAKKHSDYSDRIIADFPALLMAEGLKPRLTIADGLTPPANLAEAPELLAGYHVIRQIGQGNMGVVYEAEHPRLSRRLAIKVLPGKGTTTLAEGFRREAEAASRLNHPNIVPVFDFGEQNGVQYLTMALIEGQSLDQMLERYRAAHHSAADTKLADGLLTMVTNAPWSKSSIESSTPVPECIEGTAWIGPEADFRKLAALGAEVASALVHSHSNKTIHRNIKPGNLILDNAGKIWVTDFGLAKVRDDDSDFNRTGEVIGTLRFMAPEQLRGHCDERSDIYSLGITLYEMASGTRVWDSLNTAQLMKLRSRAELPELSEQAPFVPQPLAEIIMKACSNRPEDRYQSAQEMQLVLNRFAHDQKTGDRRCQSRHQASFLGRRWVIVACSLGVPALTFGAMYAFSLGPWSPARFTMQEALNSLVQNDAHREKEVEQLSDLTAAAITSKDATVREQVADLTLKVVEEVFRKPDASQSQMPEEARQAKQEMMSRVREYTEEHKRSGFVYDKMNHPLTNAIRNLDLAQQISDLTLSAEDKLAAQAKIAAMGEAIRRKFLNEQEATELLSLLPVEAQTTASAQKVSGPKLIRFIMLLKETYEVAGRRLSAEQQILKKRLEQELKMKKKTPLTPEPAQGLLGKGAKPPASPKQMPF